MEGSGTAAEGEQPLTCLTRAGTSLWDSGVDWWAMTGFADSGVFSPTVPQPRDAPCWGLWRIWLTETGPPRRCVWRHMLRKYGVCPGVCEDGRGPTVTWRRRARRRQFFMALAVDDWILVCWLSFGVLAAAERGQLVEVKQLPWRPWLLAANACVRLWRRLELGRRQPRHFVCASSQVDTNWNLRVSHSSQALRRSWRNCQDGLEQPWAIAGTRRRRRVDRSMKSGCQAGLVLGWGLAAADLLRYWEMGPGG